MDGPCGGEEDGNWLGTDVVKGPLPVQGGLAASRAGRKIVVISEMTHVQIYILQYAITDTHILN